MSNTARKYREAADLFGDSQRNTAHLRLLHGDMSGDSPPRDRGSTDGTREI